MTDTIAADTSLDLIRNKPDVEVVDITPGMAEQMIGHNTHNRNIRHLDVSGYARDMAAGDWQYTAEPIRFDTNGVLIDGQHRLLAIIESGVTVRALIAYGLEPESQHAVDTGIPRKFHDVLKLRGEANSHTLAAVVAAVGMWERGFRRLGDGNRSLKLTNPQKLHVLESHPELRAVSTNATRVASHCALPASLIGLCWWLFDAIDSEDTTYFFDRLASDTDHAKGDPIYELRRTAAESKDVRGERSRTWLLAITIKAWNAYRNGDKVSLYRYRTGGSRPEQFPEPI